MDAVLQNLIRQYRANPADTEVAQRIAALVARSSSVDDSDDQYALVMNPRQAQVIIDSLDLFSRLLIGQMDEAAEPFRFSKNLDHAAFSVAREILNSQIKPLLFPGMPPNASHSIGSPVTPDRAKIAFDIQQVIRHRLAWDRDKGEDQAFRGVHHDVPRRVSDENLPSMEAASPCKCGRSDCKTGW